MSSALSRTLHGNTVIGKVFLLLGGIILAVALGEGLLRLFVGMVPTEMQQRIESSPRHMGVSHPYIGHLHSPNKTFTLAGKDFRAVHHVGDYGFRNHWRWPEQAEIVALGDSLTFGQGVEDEQAWPSILARAFPQSCVINLGLVGADPQQYLRVYETFGRNLHAKVLLIGLFVGNDFWDADLFDLWLRSGAGGNYMVWRDYGRPRKIAGIKRTLRWKTFLLARESYLFNLLYEAWMVGKRKSMLEPKIFALPDGSQLQLFPKDFARLTAGAQPDRREFQLVVQALQHIQSIAEEDGTHTFVILQPSKEEVYLPLLGDPPPDPAAPLRHALEKLGMAYLDLTPAFRQHAAAGEKLFFEVDGHPNAQGYRLIAELVISHLKANAQRYGLEDRTGGSY